MPATAGFNVDTGAELRAHSVQIRATRGDNNKIACQSVAIRSKSDPHANP